MTRLRGVTRDAYCLLIAVARLLVTLASQSLPYLRLPLSSSPFPRERDARRRSSPFSSFLLSISSHQESDVNVATLVVRAPMSKRSYQHGPMDPSGDLFGSPGPSKRPALSLLEAIRQDFRKDTGVLRRQGNGFIYRFGSDTFYSPNCNRPDVRVPAKLDTSTSPSVGASKPATTSSGVLFGRDYDLDTFLQPQ